MNTGKIQVLSYECRCLQELAAMPQTPGARGDQERHYYFEEAGREMGYHLYVPESYDPAVGAPLVVALHGFGVN